MNPTAKSDWRAAESIVDRSGVTAQTNLRIHITRLVAAALRFRRAWAAQDDSTEVAEMIRIVLEEAELVAAFEELVDEARAITRAVGAAQACRPKFPRQRP